MASAIHPTTEPGEDAGGKALRLMILGDHRTVKETYAAGVSVHRKA